jgi:hypothetical protein
MMRYIDEKFIETITISIFHLQFKENNENDMTAYGICFDFYYQPKPCQIEQNSSAAAADTRLAGYNEMSTFTILSNTQ